MCCYLVLLKLGFLVEVFGYVIDFGLLVLGLLMFDWEFWIKIECIWVGLFLCSVNVLVEWCGVWVCCCVGCGWDLLEELLLVFDSLFI